MAGSHGGCRCPECFTFREWALENLGDDYGLPPARGHAPLPDPCDGTLTCTCPSCKAGRTRLVKTARKAPARQPWEPRPSRRAA